MAINMKAAFQLIDSTTPYKELFEMQAKGDMIILTIQL